MSRTRYVLVDPWGKVLGRFESRTEALGALVDRIGTRRPYHDAARTARNPGDILYSAHGLKVRIARDEEAAP